MAIRVPTLPALLHSLIKSIQLLQNPNARWLSTTPDPPIPNLLSSKFSPQSNLISLSNIFLRYGFPPSQLHNFLKKNRFLLNSSSSDIEKSLKLLLSLKPSQEFLVSVVYSCPSVLDYDFLSKWKRGFSDTGFFISNFTALGIQNVLEVSRKYSLDPDDISSCVQLLKGLGFSDSTVARVIEAVPMVILMSEGRIRGSLGMLRGLGIEWEGIDRIVNLFPGILAPKEGMRLDQLLDEFKGFGFGRDLIRQEILKDPRVIGLEVGELSQCLRMLNSLKCRVPIKEKIFRDGAFRAAFEVKLRIDCLRRHGLIYNEAFRVAWREPRIILYQIEEIEKKIEFLVHEMKLDIGWLVEVPEYLGVNFQKHIVPRYTVIDYLRSQGGLGDEVGLKAMIKLSRMRFYNLYVKPYPECEKIYGRFADLEVKSQHPVGLWKLFKPQTDPVSKEDAKNIRTFMESLV